MSPTVPDTAPEAAPSAASPTVLTRSVRYHADGGALLEQLTRSGLLRTTAGPAAQGGSMRPVDWKAPTSPPRPRVPRSPSWRPRPG